MNTASSDHRRYVFVERVRCPACGSDRLKTTRSTFEDGARQKRTVCVTCAHRFIVVIE